MKYHQRKNNIIMNILWNTELFVAFAFVIDIRPLPFPRILRTSSISGPQLGVDPGQE